ncbi:MAG TPA: serine hydrolase domain-containing protein [Steroidobacteraceae bacterium]|nr:serine hydrolase domain-containing protein [Steroidobacteraceae bacterium]
MSLLADLHQQLAQSIERHGVPGAAVAVWCDGHLHETSAGVANAHTRVHTTPDTIFQIGSITKSFTATLALQLVEQGKLSLDAPIAAYLPQLQLAERDVPAAITIRHLLAHSSGIDGDLLTDTGRDADALARFVASLGSVRQLHPAGELLSYCNLGYNILGRVLEAVSGEVWDDLLRQRILTPLGLTRAVTSADAALRHRVAIGHVRGEGGEPQRVDSPFAPRSNGPSGMTMACTARELVIFGRAHLDGGCGPDGARILSQTSIATMRTLQTANAYSDKYRGWGLGWMLFDEAAQRMFGHDGGACGNCAFLRILPGARTIVALLVNHERGMGVYRDLFASRLATLAGIDPPVQLAMPARTPDGVELAPYAGSYRRHGQIIDLELDAQRRLAGRLHGEYVGASDVKLELAAFDAKRFVAAAAGTLVPVHFSGFDERGRPARLHVTDRVFIRHDPA